jgi:hypothetical protein
VKLYTICIDANPVATIRTGGDSETEDMREINSALDTWLGEDLQTSDDFAAALWDGDPSRVVFREATGLEGAPWRQVLKMHVLSIRPPSAA